VEATNKTYPNIRELQIS